MTGSRSPLDFAGVQTLSVRQSSLAGPGPGATQRTDARAARRPGTSGSELRGISHVRPRFGRHGWAPPTVAGWRSGVRNTLERHDVSPTASHRPGLRVNRCRDWLRRLSVYDGKSERDGHQLQDPAHR